MQGMRLQCLALAVLALSLYWSSPIEGLKFIPIYDPLTIKVHRESPPHIAFEEIYEGASRVEPSSQFYRTINLSEPHRTPYIPKPSFELPTMTLSSASLNKEPRTTSSIENTQIQNEKDDRSWTQSLNSAQMQRLEKAQFDKKILDQDWTPPTWKELAFQKLKESGVLQDNLPSKILVSSDVPERSRPQVSVNAEADSQTKTSQYGRPSIISGPVLITGGLGITNDQTVTLHRMVEGVVQESGTVDVKEGTYSIDVSEASGDLVAVLTSEDGSIIGKGLASLDSYVSTAPQIKIKPRVDYSVAARSAYDTSIMSQAPKGTKISFLNDESLVAANTKGVAELHNVVEGSSTLARVRAKGHLQTNLLAFSGQEMNAEIFPETMMKALIEIVNSQRNISAEGMPSIVWGRVKGLKEGVAGVQVLLESAPYLEAVYFDDFMIPDINLKATGTSGLFAFIGASEGLHSLVAYREEQLIGYQNTVVEDSVVSVANIDVFGPKQKSSVRVYDAFMGSPQAATLSVQALNKEVMVAGELQVETSQIARMGLIKSKPVSEDYAPSRYLFNEGQKEIYIPLISNNWLMTVKNTLKFPDVPDTGTVLGFVPQQDFEVYLAGVEDISQHIVYFDGQGRVLQNRQGVAGGGFIMFNLPPEVMEVVVIGKSTHKMDTRVLPVDASSLSVLTFIATQ